MNILVYFAKYWWYCLITGALMWGLPHSMSAQDPLWAIGDQQVHFPQELGGFIKVSDLPTSFNDDIPNQYEYQGALAQRTQNVQFDDEGKVLFFIMDGKIYNRDGLLIADEALDREDRNCEVCFLGGEQVHIIPVPGSCTRYFIIGLYFGGFNRDLGDELAMARMGVLDVTLDSDIGAYQDVCIPVKGSFIDNIDLSGQDVYQFTLGSSTNIIPEVGFIGDTGNGVFREGVLHSSLVEQTGPIHGASIRLDQQGNSILAVRVNQGLVLLQAAESGLWMLDNPPGYIGSRWPFDINSSALDTEVTQRGEMALNFDEGTLTVAWSAYYQGPLNDDNGVPIPWVPHQTLVGRWDFQIVGNTPYTVLSNIQPSGSIGQNPRLYSLDLYPATDPPPLDILNDPIQRPAIAGLEFSPNGRYLYFVKSPDYAHPSGGVASNFGFIDMDWTLQDLPLTYHTWVVRRTC